MSRGGRGEGVAVVSSRPSLLLLGGGLLALLMSLAPVEGAVLAGRLASALIGLALIAFYLRASRGSEAARAARRLVSSWDPASATVDMGAPVEYVEGWLVVEALPGPGSRGRTVFLRVAAPRRSSRLVFEPRYLLIYSYERNYVLLLPAAMILESCCKGAVIAMTPSTLNGSSGTVKASLCGEPDCPRASITLEPGRVVVAGRNPTDYMVAVTVCGRPRLGGSARKCVDLVRLEPVWEGTITLDARLPPLLLVTHEYAEPAAVAAALRENGRLPRVAGDLAGMAELEVSVRRLAAGIL